MATSPYFNHSPKRVTSEQLLIEDLINEQIKLWGLDVYYLPRHSMDKLDRVYGEDPISLFNTAYKIEMYMANPTGDEGQREFFSKFGLEIRDSGKFVIARRAFEKNVTEIPRPNEGDLIYVETFNNIYEIKFVDEEKAFYTLGRQAPLFYYFELTVELHKFSNDRFLTGVDAIDDIARDYAFSIRFNLGSGSGDYQPGEDIYQGTSMHTATTSGVVKRWDKANTAVDIMNIVGVFANGVNVVGNTSNAIYTINDFNRQQIDRGFEDINNNIDLEEEANTIIDFSTDNPFGDPS